MRIWPGVHAANDAFLHEVGTELPSHGVEIDADAVTAGVPFSPFTSIWWPGGFPVGYHGGGDSSITWHEYGHVVRAGFDGDLGHFLGDVVTDNYLQTHEKPATTPASALPSTRAGPSTRRRTSCRYRLRVAGDMETEGNVAPAPHLSSPTIAPRGSGNRCRSATQQSRHDPLVRGVQSGHGVPAAGAGVFPPPISLHAP